MSSRTGVACLSQSPFLPTCTPPPLDEVWKVARYTSAAPMFFTEVDNYVDGGVICNNPTDYGLTKIQNFCRQQGMKLPIAVVVSIGSGRYPPQEMGIVDAQEALFFGKQWLKPGKLIKKTQNLFSLLSNAVSFLTHSTAQCPLKGEGGISNTL